MRSLLEQAAPAADDDEDESVGQDHEDEQGVEGVGHVDADTAGHGLDVDAGVVQVVGSHS